MSPEPTRETPNRRRSGRVVTRLAIHLTGEGADGRPVDTPAETLVVSHHGALISADTSLRPGSQVSVLNAQNGESGQFRVVWATEKPRTGKWDIGLELPRDTPMAWGIELPPE